jgi:hypothetical protein
MTLVIKDAFQQPQSLGTQSDSASNLATEHVPCSMVGGVATPVSTTAPLPVINAAGAIASGASGSITTGGTAQFLFGGDTPVNGFQVQNNHASEALWVNDLGTAGVNVGFQVTSGGGMYQTPDGYRPPGAVSIYAASTSHPFTARQW